MNVLTFKRTIFWFEAAFALALLCTGFILTLKLLLGANELSAAVSGYLQFAWHNVVIAAREFARASSEAWLAALCILTYIISIYYLSQTEREKKLVKYIVGIFLIGLFLSVTGLVAMALSGLAMQGGGH